MPVTVLDGIPIEGVKRVEITTEEATPISYRFTTSDEVDADPVVSQGEEKELRVKNEIIASANTEDILRGFDLKFKDNTFKPEVLALIDGGTATFTGEDFTKYESPAIGSVVNRTPFTIDIYTAEADTDGEVLSYLKFTFKHCKGTPVKFSFKDGEFFVPEFSLKSRAKAGEKPCTIVPLTQLPA